MKRKILIIVGIIYVAFIVEFIFYFNSDTDPQPEKAKNGTVHNPKIKSINSTALKQTSEGSVSNQTAHPVKSQDEPNIIESNSNQPTITDSGEFGHEMPLANIEEIKHKIYDMQIEYIEDLEALEGIIQTGAADQSNYWEGDWASADDWKRRDDSFQLKIDNNGSFTFFTEDEIHQPSQAFTFDEEKSEFYWEEDYYGKIISHRAKFVTPSTLLIIKTSGIKVNLDIYEKAPE